MNTLITQIISLMCNTIVALGDITYSDLVLLFLFGLFWCDGY